MLKKYLSRTDIKIFLFCSLFLMIFVMPNARYGISCSRLATMESLVENSTFILDKSSFTSKCTDKIYINCSRYSMEGCNHFYSEKPPFLSVAGAGFYLIFNKIFGLQIEAPFTIFLFVFLINIIPFSLLLMFFYRSLGFVHIKERSKLLLTLGLGFGTAMLAYTFFLNNSIISVLFFFLSFYSFLKLKFLEDTNVKLNLFLAGLFLGLASIIDYTHLVFIPLFSVYVLLIPRLRSKLLYFASGLAIPLSIHFILNYIIFETYKPGYFIEGAFNYKGSVWQNFNTTKMYNGTLDALYNLTFKKFGLFVFSPVVIIPFIYLLFAMFHKKHELKKEAWVIFIGACIVYYAYAAKFASSYASLGFGFRYGFMLLPCIMFFGAYFFKEERANALSWLFYIVLLWSIIISFIGLLGTRGWVPHYMFFIKPWIPLTFFILFFLFYYIKEHVLIVDD